MRARFLIWTALVLVLACASGPAFEDKPSPEQLVMQAHKLADLTSIGPYVLTAQMIANPGKKHEMVGALTVHRNGTSVRVDVQFGNRIDTRVTVGDKYYFNPETTLIAVNWLNQIDRSWDPEPVSGAESQFKLKKPSRSIVAGREAWCMERKNKIGHDRLCIDSKGGFVLRSSFMEFANFKNIGSAWFPQSITILDPDTAPIKIRNIKVTPSSPQSGLFEVPPGAWEFESCDVPAYPKPIETPLPPTFDLGRHF